MKKIKAIFFVCGMVLLLCPSVFAQEENQSLSDAWKKFGNSAKDAAKTLGNAVVETGKQIGDELNEAFDANYFGTWVFKSEKATTTIICNENKTMQITQKTSSGTNFWKGTASGAVAFISFKITESGSSSFLGKKSVKDDKTWRLTYSLSDDKKILYVKCASIPTTEDGHNFSNETAFFSSK